MARVGSPAELNQLIAQRAVRIARQNIRSRQWSSSGALQPFSDSGQVGITSTMKHLLIQNRGFKPFVMYWVEGRMVPIKDKQTGQTRSVLGKGAGTPGWVNIPGRGKVWRDQRWKHPGLAPKRFIESSIQQAIKESRSDIQAAAMNILKGGQ